MALTIRDERDTTIREYWRQRALGNTVVKNEYTKKIERSLAAARGQVLDIGCGRGRWMRLLAVEGLVGVDFVYENCKSAHSNTGHDIVCADARNLPFKSESFDYVYSIQMLGSFPRSTLALQEAFRVGRTGSGVLLTFLNRRSPYSIISYIRSVSGRLPFVERFTPNQVKMICSRSLQHSTIQVTGIPLPPKLQLLLQLLESTLGNDIVVTGERT